MLAKDIHPQKGKFIGSKHSIRTKLIVIYLLAATLPLIIVGIVSYSLTFQGIQKTSVDNFTNVADQLNKNIELLLTDSRNFLKISQSEEVQSFLSNSHNAKSEYAHAMAVVNLFKTYRKLFDFNNYIANVVILNMNGRHISEHRGVYSLPIHINDLAIVKRIRNSPDNISIIPGSDHPYMVPYTTQDYLSICSVIKKNVTHEELGYIIVNVKMEALQNLVQEISPRSLGDFFIVESPENFLYPDNYMFNEEDLDPSYIETISQQKRGFFNASYHGEDSFFVFNTLDLTGWKIIGRSNRRDLLASAITIRNISITVLAVIMTLSILFYIYISSKITYPIRSLKECMRKVEQGDLTLKAELYSQDEIADLAHSFNSMIGKIRELLDVTREEQLLSKKMEFKALQAQINPHFLYNSLDSILWMAEAGKKDDIITITKSLSNFFRISLSKGSDKITIKDEISHVNSYLVIQKLRYRDILNYEIDVPETLFQYKIIKIILQPLVENALYHGIKNTRNIGLLRIIGREDDHHIRFEVIDNGIGMNAIQLSELHSHLTIPITHDSVRSGYGLRNVYQRLKLEYEDAFGFEITSKENIGTTVLVIIPKEKADV